jgi:release factor glutamine methyltransferase
VTIREVLARSTDYLAAKGVDSPRLDAEHLLAHTLGISRLDLYLEHDRSLSEDELGRARVLVERRGRREPLAYVLGEWGFRRLTLKVDDRALVPRPETEVVVERCLEHLRGIAEPAVLDVGTGTGAIALSIVDEHPGAVVTALEASPDALALTRENIELTGLSGRLRLVEGDLRATLPPGPYDLVVSNPPYVTPGELPALQPEVRDWEPRVAVVDEDGGATGAVARGAAEVLKADGWLVLEVAEGSAARVADLVAGLGFQAIACRADLAGRDRVVEGRWASSRKR